MHPAAMPVAGERRVEQAHLPQAVYELPVQAFRRISIRPEFTGAGVEDLSGGYAADIGLRSARASSGFPQQTRYIRPVTCLCPARRRNCRRCAAELKHGSDWSRVLLWERVALI